MTWMGIGWLQLRRVIWYLCATLGLRTRMASSKNCEKGKQWNGRIITEPPHIIRSPPREQEKRRTWLKKGRALPLQIVHKGEREEGRRKEGERAKSSTFITAECSRKASDLHSAKDLPFYCSLGDLWEETVHFSRWLPRSGPSWIGKCISDGRIWSLMHFYMQDYHYFHQKSVVLFCNTVKYC